MATAAVVGLGNIGSHTVQHLARMAEIDQLILVDRDCYEEKNLRTQYITASDLGKPKAPAQAERIASVTGSQTLKLRAIVEDIGSVPWGMLECHILLSCCDNRRARQYAAEIAWRKGIPYVDAGVRNDGLLARVDVYVPGSDELPCYECSWTTEDYERTGIHYPCSAGNGELSPGTGSPSYLGSLAASLQAAECAKILSGNIINAGSRIVISARSYRCYHSRITRNTMCRFDHHSWAAETLEALPAQMTVHQILGKGSNGFWYSGSVRDEHGRGECT